MSRMLLILAALLLSACGDDLSPPMDGSTLHGIEVAPVEFSLGMWGFEWRQVGDGEFVYFCGQGSEPVSVSLTNRTAGIQILAARTGSGLVCVFPEDGAFEDIVLRSGHSYRVTVISTDEPLVLLRFGQ